MKISLPSPISNAFIRWLLRDKTPRRQIPLTDFERLSYEIRPCDVLLIEGLNRVSEIIRLVTQSPWTHTALYIGRLHDIENPVLREQVSQYVGNNPEEQLIIESLLGQGTVVSSLKNYSTKHIRICRPHGISRKDAQQVSAYAIGHIGVAYDVRRILDLMRFLYPWSILPRRWRSSLFNFHPGKITKEICSSLIAAAFGSVDFPILPHVKEMIEDPITGEKRFELIRRNPKLFTPSDFDYSPYFDIIKYPMFELDLRSTYSQLPWNKEGLMSDDEGRFSTPEQSSKREKAK